MLRGMATVSYWADDVEEAAAWYRRVVGIEPYFQRSDPATGRPAYVEFRVGVHGDELGIIDRRFAPDGDAVGPSGAGGPAGTVLYWHVDDVVAANDALLALGATVHQPPIERGEGFTTASVVDPFGNILGVMENPHWAAAAREG